MRIQQLPKQTADLIAAGEVVERPLSVVKELVENALDACASKIIVEIAGGGLLSIRVTDDGSGMRAAETTTAFLRHATSKIATADDLFAIGTLGFRGEALCAIGAVSRVSLLTRHIDELEGSKTVLEGGELHFTEEAAAAQGTTIVVRDLFYNTPARLKFLKKDYIEAGYIESMLTKMALAFPHVAFRFIKDNKDIFSTPGDGNLTGAVYALFGGAFSKGLLPIEYENDGLSVTGFVSNQQGAQKSRKKQIFFVNRRVVRNTTMQAALEEACKGKLTSGYYPACILNLDIDLSMVDVNVHPAKMEIKFARERSVFDVIYFGVKNALQGGQPFYSAPARTAAAPSLQSEAPPVVKASVAPASASAPVFRPAPPLRPSAAEITADIRTQQQSHGLANDILWQLSDMPPVPSAAQYSFAEEPTVSAAIVPPMIEEAEAQIALPAESPVPDFRVVGEIFTVYILVECEGQLLLFDKHAAHEAILYERLLSGAAVESQLLLAPEIVVLEGALYHTILDNKELFFDNGFDFEPYGESCLAVRACPALLDASDAASLLEEMADNLLQHKKGAALNIYEALYHQIACKGALKQGKATSMTENTALVRDVLSSPTIRNCPHGRPVAVEKSKREIEKWFFR